MDNISEEFNKHVNGAFKVIDSNRVFSTVLALFLALYASLAAPALPKSITNIFKSTWFRLLFMFMIAYISTKNPSVAIISAVALLVTLQTLHAQETTDSILASVEKKMVDNFENFADVEGADYYDKSSEYESVSSEETTDLLTSDDLLNTKEKRVKKINNVEAPISVVMENKEIRVEIPTRNEIVNLTIPSEKQDITSEKEDIPSEKEDIPSETQVIPSEEKVNSEIFNVSIPSESLNIPMAMYIEKPKNNENVNIFIPSENNNLNKIKLNTKKQVVFARVEEEEKKNMIPIDINNENNNKNNDDEEEEEEEVKEKEKNNNKEDDGDDDTDFIDAVLGFENIENFSPIRNINFGVTKSCLTNNCFTMKENFNNSESNGSCKDIISTIPGFEDNEFASF